MSSIDDLVHEASRQFDVCLACRYCEAYCAVFPAMERRSLFASGDVSYIANVCHDCRSCYQACMYVAPHPFELNIPALLADVRVAAYDHYARPRWLARVFRAGRVALAGAALTATALVLALIVAAGHVAQILGVHIGPGAFYRLLPHLAMAVPALLVGVGATALAAVGLVSFWRDTGGRGRELLDPRLWATALWEAAVMRWMRGGGDNCYYPTEETTSPVRRWLHQSVMWGFLSTFAATCAAFVEESWLHRLPPYGWISPPVQLGIWGGAGIVVGATGLIELKRQASRRLTTEAAREMDYVFLVMLDLAAVSGIALLLLRTTSLMGPLLVAHLAIVFAFLAAVPYGKAMHAVLRIGALLKDVQERRAEGERSPAPSGGIAVETASD